MPCGRYFLGQIPIGQIPVRGRERGRHVFVFLVLRKWKVPCLCSCPLKSHFSNWSARSRKSWKWLKSFSSTCWESVASSFLVAISLTSQLLGHVCPTQSKWREGTSWGRDRDIYPHQTTLSGPSILGVLGSQSKLAIFSGVLVSVPQVHLSVPRKMLYPWDDGFQPPHCWACSDTISFYCGLLVPAGNCAKPTNW